MVWIKASYIKWGPKTFKVYNWWFDHKDFLDFVKKECDSCSRIGKKSYVLKEKFKYLKERLKWWNKLVFDWIDQKIEDGVE